MMAAFHLAMEASIRKTQERLDVLREVGAVEALRKAASRPDEAASEFARRALEIIGEPAPYKLKPQVPLWTVDDVQYWVVQVRFGYFCCFCRHFCCFAGIFAHCKIFILQCHYAIQTWKIIHSFHIFHSHFST